MNGPIEFVVKATGCLKPELYSKLKKVEKFVVGMVCARTTVDDINPASPITRSRP